ncbi:histidine phosphatase family protein [Glaciecola sp. 2405UD65-10]|uniref:histidine phosphatase family protein n=1 Tax=Glaciecola sp. 2405UD65-10 TaxID=3397244 RepID=UPI003B5B57A9
MAQLFLVRHAQASFGAADYDNLSELGHLQSKLLGNYFSERDIQFDATITGSMKRHIQTKEGILASTQIGSAHIDEGWNEFDFDNIVRAYLSIFPRQKPDEKAPRSEWYKVLRNAMQAWSEGNLPSYKGESWAEFVGRVKDSAQMIQESSHKNVLVVTSGGAMAIFLMTLLKCSVAQAINFNLQIKNTSVNQFYFNKGGFQLSSFNNVPHLDKPLHMSKITYS